MEVGRRLRELREIRHLHAGDVAYALGYTRSALSRIETGLRKLDLIEAENFAVFYGFKLENLATWYSRLNEDRLRDMILTVEDFRAREEEARKRRKNRPRKKDRADQIPQNHNEPKD